jgi:hypothetical protein
LSTIETSRIDADDACPMRIAAIEEPSPWSIEVCRRPDLYTLFWMVLLADDRPFQGETCVAAETALEILVGSILETV